MTHPERFAHSPPAPHAESPLPGSLLNTTALEPARGSSPSPANRQDFNTLSVMRGKRPGALLRRVFAIHTGELPMKHLLRLTLDWKWSVRNTTLKVIRAQRWIHAVFAWTLLSALFAPSVGADPEITPDRKSVV